jgi:hypothetical protein
MKVARCSSYVSTNSCFQPSWTTLVPSIHFGLKSGFTFVIYNFNPSSGYSHSWITQGNLSALKKQRERKKERKNKRKKENKRSDGKHCTIVAS